MENTLAFSKNILEPSNFKINIVPPKNYLE